MGIFGAKFIQSILNGWGYFFKERMINEVEVLIETILENDKRRREDKVWGKTDCSIDELVEGKLKKSFTELRNITDTFKS